MLCTILEVYFLYFSSMACVIYIALKLSLKNFASIVYNKVSSSQSSRSIHKSHLVTTYNQIH